ncbi:MAG: WG repeat-containing protein, partial [Cytophagaceae bacterium]
MRLSLFILLCLYSFTTNAQDLVPYSNNGLWGFFSTSRQQALEMKYQETGPFKGNIALVKKGNKWGAVNTELSVIIAPEYERIEFISKDLLRAAKAGR